MLAYLAHKNFQPRYLAGDGLYANADPATFHNPARDSGWRLILPVLDANLGIQTTVEGFHLIEGHWYCPSIPTILIDATRDFRAKTIDLDTYEARIAERAKYRARLREDKGSGVQRFGCPASGIKATVMCDLKPRSTASDRMLISQGPGIPVRLRDRIIPDPTTATGGVYPKPCRVDTVRIDLSTAPDSSAANVDAARFRQEPHLRHLRAHRHVQRTAAVSGRTPRIRQGRSQGSTRLPRQAPHPRTRRPITLRRRSPRRRSRPQGPQLPVQGADRPPRRPLRAPSRAHRRPRHHAPAARQS